MPRNSKFQANSLSNTPSTANAKLWHPALYIRLSREDGDKEESDSIANQRTQLEDFLTQQPDMAPPKIYQDDGWSGTSFDRPAFEQMMADARAGKINCIIVKDLSRLGRNYIGVGTYLEQVFPLLNLRFISVNDHLDSYLSPQTMNTLLIPVKNILNDEYARDISNKIRSSLDIKRKQGQFIGSFASYGYVKDPNQKGKLLIDDEAAAVVQDIYQWFLEGTSIIGIAKRLNALGVPNPSEYKRRKGFDYRHPAGEMLDGLWPDSSVRRILRNKLYTGTMVQGKNRIKSYKLHVSEAIPSDQWIEVENTHPAIIDKETFDRVQDLFTRDRRASPATQKEYLFSGLLRCADCKRAMNRKLISQPYGDYHYYICATYKKMNNGACTKHTIRSDRLEQAVLQAVQQQIALAVEMDELIASINETSGGNRQSQRLQEGIRRAQQAQETAKRMKLELYPDWKNGDISKEEYTALKAKFEMEIDRHDQTIAALQAQQTELQQGVDGTNAFLKEFKQYRNLQHLTRDIVTQLIDMIYVHEGGDITIQFTFADAFQLAREYIEGQEEK
ncbi:recombinase family protein [Bengtsoniella intestinalis]|uniref:recombinase family protein n=1 Tax=Bengtsoniella intestinalis TaxID=3073143 RepID=UPI00391F8A0E